MKDHLGAVKKKARMLQRAFPANFTLAQAQEATAKLLGFQDWHWLTRAASEGKLLLPAQPLSPSDSGYAQAVARVVMHLHDQARVHPRDAQEFYWGWGVFSPALASPFEPEYFYWDKVLKGESPDRDEVDEDDVYNTQRLVIDGVIEGSDYRDTAWYLSPERLAQMQPVLRGMASAFSPDEDGAAVILSFPEEFSATEVKRAQKYMRSTEPDVYLWIFGASDVSGYQNVSVAGTRARAAALPDHWFPLSVRWKAVPYDADLRKRPDIVLPAMQGSKLVELIESKGLFRLEDIRWFEGPWRYPLNGIVSPLDLRACVECEPQYAYPFKRRPFGNDEYLDQEGGDGGLAFVPEQD